MTTDAPEPGALVMHEAGQAHVAKSPRAQKALLAQAEKIRQRQAVEDLEIPMVKAALETSNGILRQAAMLLQVDYDAFCEWIARNKEIYTFRLALRNRVIDMGEQTMVGLMRSKDPQVAFRAAQFVLSRLGGDRGWRETKEKRISREELEAIRAAMTALVLQFVPPARQAEAEAFFFSRLQESIVRQNTGGMAEEPVFRRSR